MAFRKKADFILESKPDIVIIPECEEEAKLKFGMFTPKPNKTVWFGENPNKGIGIFSYGDYEIELLEVHNPEFKFVLPLSVSKGDFQVTLFAVWSQESETNNNYTEQVWNAIHFYKDILKEEHVILAGDFNSNTIWDRPKRVANHSEMVRKLEEIGIKSTYHQIHEQVQGKEKDPTLYMQRKVERPYHIDYCFVSDTLMKNVTKAEVGNPETWLRHSDHMPLTIDFNI
jgi:exonuclease III